MFRRKEKRLYQISDYIGCTSPGNIEFVLKHNKEVVASKLNICPNSVELQGLERGDKNKSKLLKRLMIPPTKTLFIYGGIWVNHKVLIFATSDRKMNFDRILLLL